MTYTITEAEVRQGRVVFKAEDDGDIIHGRITEGVAPNIFLTDKALEDLADEVVGEDLSDDIDVRDTEVDTSIGWKDGR